MVDGMCNGLEPYYCKYFIPSTLTSPGLIYPISYSMVLPEIDIKTVGPMGQLHETKKTDDSRFFQILQDSFLVPSTHHSFLLTTVILLFVTFKVNPKLHNVIGITSFKVPSASQVGFGVTHAGKT
jgi:hypothetical protein